MKEHNKNYFITAVIIVVVVLFGYYFIIKPINQTSPYTSGQIHWHANFEVDLCGVKQDFTHGYDFEENRIGTLQLHTHNDGIIHVEEQVMKKEDIALGKFFDNIRVTFTDTQIIDKKNGDLCPNGTAGKVHMYVNGVENYEFRNFILRPCTSENIEQDCDHILIKFE